MIKNNEEAITLIQEIEEDGRNVTSEHMEALDLAGKAVRIVEIIEDTFKRDNNLMMDIDDWKEVKEAVERE